MVSWRGLPEPGGIQASKKEKRIVKRIVKRKETSGKAGFVRWMDGTVAKSMCEEAAVKKNCDGPLWAAGDWPKHHHRPQNL